MHCVIPLFPRDRRAIDTILHRSCSLWSNDLRPFHEHIAHLVLQLSIRLNILFLKYSPRVSNVYGRAIQLYIILIKDIVLKLTFNVSNTDI